MTEHDQQAAGDKNTQRQQEPQLEATIVSISQPATYTPARPSTVPNLHSRTDKHDSAARSKSAKPSNKKHGKGYESLEDLEGEEDSEGGLSPIDEQILEEVLYSRPTLRLGREMSMRFRAQTAIPSRRRRIYKSLPHGAKRPKTTGASGPCVYVFVCML